jgi:hypothetical protein
MAAWDLAERLTLLPIELKDANSKITPFSLLLDFNKHSTPFLNLSGGDIPQKFHLEYDQIDTVVREEIFPAFDVLTEEWLSLKEKKSDLTYQDQLEFAAKCVYIANQLGMYVIPLTSPIEKGLMPQVK